MTIYDFTVTDNQGKQVSLKDYEGKVVLIVNTATKCGLTPQYEQLEAMYQKNKDAGFVILDFPSNQFLEQAPGTDEEINSFCTMTYNTTFPRFQKVNVNGEEAAPLFVYLKEQLPTDINDDSTKEFANIIEDLRPFKGSSDIQWNFGKFLIDRTGKPVARYYPAYSPQSIQADIDKLL